MLEIAIFFGGMLTGAMAVVTMAVILNTDEYWVDDDEER